jgi:hypothetical protein
MERFRAFINWCSQPLTLRWTTVVPSLVALVFVIQWVVIGRETTKIVDTATAPDGRYVAVVEAYSRPGLFFDFPEWIRLDVLDSAGKKLTRFQLTLPGRFDYRKTSFEWPAADEVVFEVHPRYLYSHNIRVNCDLAHLAWSTTEGDSDAHTR